ncbi:MAG: type II toxin-antitoxin system RnlB family antitoxin [Lachnospiraceae bacterium]
MNEIMIRELDSIDGYDYVIYPSSYINPLSKIKLLNEKLKNKINYPCTLLFDLLLCNGDNFNRFAKAYYDGEKVVRDSIEIVELDENEIDFIEQYYKECKNLLKNGVLTPQEYMLHC